MNLGKPEIDRLWIPIYSQVVLLHGRWLVYRQLFGTSTERVQLLNAAAGTFAQMLQDVWLDDVQLGLAKLGDKAVTCIKKEAFENMSLANLKNAAVKEGAPEQELDALLKAYALACEGLKRRRDKRIAHFDLNTMLGPEEGLEGPSRAEIEEAMKQLRAFMDCISLHFTKNRGGYEFLSLVEDGDSLLQVIKQGLRYRQLVLSEQIPREDLLNLNLPLLKD